MKILMKKDPKLFLIDKFIKKSLLRKKQSNENISGIKNFSKRRDK